MRFNGNEHKKFFLEMYEKCQEKDTYHKALIYVLGINETMRLHFHSLYDLDKDKIIPESIKAAWQTSSTSRLTRLAFNLFTDRCPTVYLYENTNDQMDELARYCISDIAYDPMMIYIFEALKIRFPEYAE